MQSLNPFILIVPFISSYTLDIVNVIIKSISSLNRNLTKPLPSWEIIHTQNPISFSIPQVNTLIKFIHPLYQNLGFLRLVDCKKHIEVRFVQPNHGSLSSHRCLAFLFSEFITFLHSLKICGIQHIAVIDHDPNIQIYPRGNDTYIKFLTHYSVDVKYFNNEIFDDILSPFSPLVRYEKSKNLQPFQPTYKISDPNYLNNPSVQALWDKNLRNSRILEFIPAYDNFQLIFYPKGRKTANKQKTIIILAILYIFYLRIRYPSTSYGIQLLNP